VKIAEMTVMLASQPVSLPVIQCPKPVIPVEIAPVATVIDASQTIGEAIQPSIDAVEATTEPVAVVITPERTEEQKNEIRNKMRAFLAERPELAEQAKQSYLAKVFSLIENQNVQNVHTPMSLAGDMMAKLLEYTSVKDKVCLTFNLEYLEFLRDAKEVVFFSDCTI
jgi:hypothetical protein